MTASWIAKELGVAVVTINYAATAISKESYEENPLKDLEFAKYGFDLAQLRAGNPEYASEEYFPDSVDVVEPTSSSGTSYDRDDPKFNMEPESQRRAKDRAISSIE